MRSETYVLIVDGVVVCVAPSSRVSLEVLASSMTLSSDYYGLLTPARIMSEDYMDYHEGSWCFIDRMTNLITGMVTDIIILDMDYLFNYTDNPEVMNAVTLYFGVERIRGLLACQR